MSRCFECGIEAETQEHHVVPRSYGGTKTIPLCLACHGKAHSRKAMSHPELTKRGQERLFAFGGFQRVLLSLNEQEQGLFCNPPSDGRWIGNVAKQVALRNSDIPRRWAYKKLVRLREIIESDIEYFERICRAEVSL